MIRSANEGFAALVGRSIDDLLSPDRELHEFVHQDSRRDFDGMLAQLEAGEEASASAVIRLQRPDGDVVWVELFLVASRDNHSQLLRLDGVARDVSEHLEVADLLSKASLEQRALLETQRELLTNLDFEETLHSIVERARDLLDARVGTLFLLDDAGWLQPTATAADEPAVSPVRRSRVGQGVVGQAVAAGEPRYVPDVAAPGETSPLREVVAGVGSMLVAPLSAAEAARGALVVVGEVGQYSEEDLNFMVALAQIASLALANSRSYRAVERLATVDALTGAFNRRFLEQNLSSELARADRIGYPLGVLMLDVDDLKSFNDRFGHPVGDQVLRHVVDVCRAQLRDTDWIVRYGGDEFVAVLPGCGRDSLRRVGEKLWAALAEEPLLLEAGQKEFVNVSMGGAVKGGDWIDPEDLIAAADSAERVGKRGSGRELRIEYTGAQPLDPPAATA